MIILIDNYDSFTYNLYQALGELYPEVEVVRNDALSVQAVVAAGARGIVLSPGPGRPEEAGICVELVRKLAGKVPLLGICLGHQAIGAAYGASIVKADQVIHGKASPVLHNGQGLFAGMPNPLRAARYHSLVIERKSLPPVLEVTAQTLDGTVMGMKHQAFEVYGLQFHPESVLTEQGKVLLQNYLGVWDEMNQQQS
ncbi:anthranilate synthase component II [Desulfotomaculum sp. 1211_IL3151]|uniref:anthranilate synthase component II n=1 Tax=Desulfotomaculum sp. 1211_IL3151 TaxID=3084055 RepID=UPI002FD9D41A